MYSRIYHVDAQTSEQGGVFFPQAKQQFPVHLANHFKLATCTDNGNRNSSAAVGRKVTQSPRHFCPNRNTVLNGVASTNAYTKKLPMLNGPSPKEKNTHLMQLPKPRYNTQISSSATDTTAKEIKLSLPIRKFGDSEAEKTFIFTGTVERVIKWGKIFQNHFCYFEVIGGVISLAEGKFPFGTTMLLRDKKGPILQVSYFSTATHIDIDDFHLGQILRIVGRITGTNTMTAHTIRSATIQEIESLPRMCYICDNAIASFCRDSLSH